MMRFRLSVLACALLLCAGLQHPAPADPGASAGGFVCVESTISAMLGSAYESSPAFPLIPAALILMVFAIALAYALGNAISRPEWLAWSKDEFFHLVMSVAIIAGCAGVIFLSCSITSGVMSGYVASADLGDSPYKGCVTTFYSVNDAASCYLANLEKVGKGLYERNTKSSINYEMESTLGLGINIPIFGSTMTSIGAHKKAYSNQLDLIDSQIIGPAVTSIGLQRLVLMFGEQYILVWGLPFGLMFRIFSPTREMGNIIIAFCISFYVFLPFLFSMNALMYASLYDKCGDYAQASADIVTDRVMGSCQDSGNMWQVGMLLPQAYFLPNFDLAVFIALLAGIGKALRVVG